MVVIDPVRAEGLGINETRTVEYIILICSRNDKSSQGCVINGHLVLHQELFVRLNAAWMFANADNHSDTSVQQQSFTRAVLLAVY